MERVSFIAILDEIGYGYFVPPDKDNFNNKKKKFLKNKPVKLRLNNLKIILAKPITNRNPDSSRQDA